MKKHLIVLMLYACFYSPTQAMEVFMRQNKEFCGTYNGTYNVRYEQKNLLSRAEKKQLGTFKTDIKNLANYLKRSIANLIVDYAHVISIFPKEGPTFEDTIGITVTKASLNQYFIDTKHKPSFKIKESLSKEEETWFAEFKNKLNAIVLAEQALSLEDILKKHNNLISYLVDGPAIELDIEIFMQKQE